MREIALLSHMTLSPGTGSHSARYDNSRYGSLRLGTKINESFKRAYDYKFKHLLYSFTKF
jgi:hypothetical protein